MMRTPGGSNTMKKLFLIVLVIFGSWVSAARADVSPEKKIEIEKMLRLTGMEKLVNQMMAQMITSFKTMNTHVPEEFWTKFQKQMDSRELIDKMIPLYDKYYSLQDLKAANTFYESPAGQRILSVTPQITQEAMKIGQAWGQEKAQEVEQALKKENQ